MRRSHVALILPAPLLALGLCACDPDLETTGHFKLVANSAAERTYVVFDEENLGAGPARLAGIAGDVSQAWYATGTERSAYLFDGNLAAGIEGGGYLQLPAYGDGSEFIEEDGISWQVIDADRPSYQSMRVYDSGSCSLNLGWETPLIPGLVPAFAPAVAAAVDARLARCSSDPSQRFSRLGSALLEPVYRARAGGSAGGLGVDDDVIRFTGRYQADSVGGCAPTTLDISFEFGFRPATNGVGVAGFLDEQSVYVEVDEFCIVEDQIENTVQNLLNTAIVPALTSTLTNRTRIDPTDIGLPAGPSCTTNAECAMAFPGTGHVCTMGACELQLNIDRVNVRPEGVELIITETDADPQRGLINASSIQGALFEGLVCGLDRGNGLLAPPVATPGTLVSTSVPAGGGAAAICP